MSTKLEELSELDDEEDLNYLEDLEDLEDTGEDPIDAPKKQADEVSLYSGLSSSIYDKVKDPVLVTFITMVITNPILSQIITSLPYVNIAGESIKLNLILSVLAGILFFIIRWFI